VLDDVPEPQLKVLHIPRVVTLPRP
jgi:hypothetical protein